MAERSFGVRLYANVTAYKAAMADAARSTDGFAKSTQARLTAVGTKMQDVGGKMTRRLTLPLALVGAGAVKLSLDFETSMTRIQALVGLSAEEVDSMRESVMRLSGQTARSPQELADALFFITSAGLKGQDALDALEFSAKAAAVGLGDTATVADLVTSAMNAYGSDVLSAAEATDALTMAVRLGKLEPDALAGAMGRVLPVASAMGIEFEEVGAAFAAMSRTGTNANEAATQLRGIMTALLSPSQQARDALAEVGFSAEGLQQSMAEDGLLPTLDMLVSSLGDNVSASEAVFGNVRALSGVMDMLGGNVDATREIFDGMTDAVGVTDDAFATMSETGAFQMQQAWADIQAALIQVGDILAPIVADVAGFIADMAQGFAGLPGPVQTVIVALGGLLAAIGPIVWIVGTLIKNLQLMMTTFAGVGLTAGPFIALTAVLVTVGFAITQLGKNSRDAAAEMAEAREEAAALAEQMRGMSDPTQILTDGFRNILEVSPKLRQAMEDTGITLENLKEQVLLGPGDPGRGIKGLTNDLRNALMASGMSREEAKALAGEVQTLGVRYRSASRAVEETDVLMGDATETMAGTEVAARDAAEGVEAVREEFAKLVSTIIGSLDSAHDYEKATLAVADSVVALADAETENALIQLDSNRTIEEKEASLRKLRRQQIGSAEDALAAAKAFAAEEGAVEGSKEEAQLMIRELDRLADKYPPLKGEIDGYIGKLDEVPGTVDTQVRVNVGQAFREMDEVERRLFRLSQRSVFIPVRVQSSGGSTFFAHGGYVGRATAAVIGEAGPEAVLPLTNIGRMRQLLADPKIARPVAAAIGGTGGPSIQIGTVNTMQPRGVRRELEEMLWMAGAR